MDPAETVIDVSTGGAIACSVGFAMGVAHPFLLPGVLVMCVMIFAFDL